MQLRQLEVFCKVADLGGFTKAAASLHLTQPAITAHIRSLEKHVGTPLFRRNGRHMALTEAGKEFYPFAVSSLERIEQGLSVIRQMIDAENQTVRLGSATNLAISYLLPAMGHFFTYVGPAKVEMLTAVSDQILQGILDQKLDLGLVWGPLKVPDIHTETIAVEEWMLIYPPDSPLNIAKPGIESPHIMNQLPFVLPQPGLTRRFVENLLATNGIQPRVAMQLSNAESIAEAVLKGKGVGVAPWKTIESYVQRGLLNYRTFSCDSHRLIVLAYKINSLKQKPFLDQVVENLSNTIESYMNHTYSMDKPSRHF